VKLEFLNQGTKKTNANFEKFALEDHGSALWNYIAEKKETLAYGLKKSANKSWFLEFSKNFKLSEIDKHEEVKGSPIQPGPFEGEIYSVKKNLSSQAAKEVFSSASELRKVIRESAGVRIYRDGFGVRVDWDWLRLGKRWTSGGSYYSLKPDNTIGHIDISASHNPMLVEMTDREGFVKNKEYDAFVLLMQTFLAYSEAVQEFLRREWTKFVQANTLNERSVGENETPESLVDSLEKTFAAAKTVSQPIGELMSVLDEELSNISEVLPKELSSIKADERSSRRLLAIANRLQPLQKRADKVLGSVAEYLDEVIALAPKGIVIKNHLSAFDRQLSQMYDTVALGLTAEALSHEVYQVADRLAERASLLERQMKDSTVSDVSLRAFVEHVNSSVIALRKQISHLSPSLRYVRERKETIHVKAFAKEFGSFYRERLREKKIRIEVDEGNSQDFTVRINGGKLTQVLDNLTLNSEYWLSEDIRLGRLEDGRIKIAVVPPLIRFSDNGRGIDPSIESLLFQPFITTKAKGRGRGLGLFISKQLLESDGCEIKVSSRRNSAGRLYVFEVELEGAQIE
jgi:signal transduction histidine kinase